MNFLDPYINGEKPVIEITLSPSILQTYPWDLLKLLGFCEA